MVVLRIDEVLKINGRLFLAIVQHQIVQVLNAHPRRQAPKSLDVVIQLYDQAFRGNSPPQIC